MNIKQALQAAIGAVALTTSLGAHAAWPERPITLVVPWPPGGGVDAAARLAGPMLAKQLGQQVIVVNRPGATGSIGADAVAKAEPDGYTLLWSSLTSHAIYSALYSRSVPYDLEKSFTPVSVFGSIPFVILVNPGVKANSVQEFISLAKAKPGALTFSTSGNGSVQHLAGEMFKRAAGVDLLHVPYKGISPSVMDLVGGQVNMSIESLAATLPHIRSEKLRPLAVASLQRISLIPDVPTANEAGLKGYDVSAKLFALAPAGTPPAIIEKLDQAFKAVFSDKAVQEPLLAQSIVTQYTSPAEAAKIIHNELTTFKTVIREANIRPE